MPGHQSTNNKLITLFSNYKYIYTTKGGALGRTDLLKPNPAYPRDAAPPTQNKRKFKPIFIITYNPHNPDLKGWLREVYFKLQADKKLRKIFPCPPSVVYRQSRSLRSHLVRSSFKELPHGDCSDQDDRPAGCYKHRPVIG